MDVLAWNGVDIDVPSRAHRQENRLETVSYARFRGPNPTASPARVASGRSHCAAAVQVHRHPWPTTIAEQGMQAVDFRRVGREVEMLDKCGQRGRSPVVDRRRAITWHERFDEVSRV